MSSLTKRVCQSDKACSSCDNTIPQGDSYMSGPYKSLCLECFEKEKIAKTNGPLNSGSDNGYVLGSPCDYCGRDSIGTLWNKKVCAACINQAITENI